MCVPYSPLTLKECQQIVNKYSDEPAECLAYKIKPYSNQTMGFMGDHYGLTISARYGIHHLSFREKQYFVKTLPRTAKYHEDCVKKSGVFEKEVLMYKNLLPKLNKICETPFAPFCYYLKPDCIVLEELTSQGYEIHKEPLDFEHCESIVKTLARFHAASIIVEEQCSTNNENYRLNQYFQKELEEATFVNIQNHPRTKWQENIIKTINNCIRRMPKYASNYEVCELLRKTIQDDIPVYINPSEEFRNVVTHADLWRNNVMFKKLDSGELHSVLVDFQFTRYAPPALDILSTFFLNAPSSFLSVHMSSLLGKYYEVFCNQLKTYNVDPKVIMPEINFQRSIEHYTLPALIEAAMFGTIVFLNNDFAQKMLSDESVFEEFNYTDRSKFVCMEFEQDAVFRERLSDILEKLVRYLLGRERKCIRV